MNEHTIAMNVITKHNFSILSILCEKSPLDFNRNAAKIIPITIIGATRVEWKYAAKRPTIITPIATNEVK